MKTRLGVAGLLALCTVLLAASPAGESPEPQYDAAGKLQRPTDYRDWEFLSAGFGMNYNAAEGSHDMFTNVFVQRWAYKEFLSSGKWPQRTMFVIDEREADSKSSINKHGHYQTDLMGLAVEVKDSEHNPSQWAYYGFGADDKSAEAMPKGNACYSCHDAHGAVEHTFVQFYPTVKVVAKKYGTYNEAREQVADAK
ncbi:MAG TPA: cytochrome P460 family protein [Candidatus Binatia bacterium]|nr:cytochrome P460 family protein [Candidatus Binatia bacterium]